MKPFIPKRDARGHITPTFLEDNADICVSAKYLYGVLCDYARDRNYCYPGKQTLADRLKVSLNSIKSWLAQLVKHGFVEIIKKGRINLFYLFCPSNEAPRNCQKLTVEVSNFDTESNVFKTNNIPPTPNVPRPVRNSKPSQVKTRVGDFSNINKNFEDFWNCYPKKEAKESARSLWFRFLRQGKLPSLDVFKKAVDFFFESSSWQRENGRYIPQLANFIRGLRWNDAPQEDVKPKVIHTHYAIESPQKRDERFFTEKQAMKKINTEIEDAYTKFKSFFSIPNKVEDCIAYGLFSEKYKTSNLPQVSENQKKSILEFLKTNLV